MCMKATLLLLFISFTVFGLDSQVCVERARNYGDGSGNDFIGSDCHALLAGQASSKAVWEQGDVEIIGQKNMIIKKEKGKLGFIAGSSSRLEEVTMLKVYEAADIKENEIVVFDNAQQALLVFKGFVFGNIVPDSVLKHQKLEGAVDYLSSRDQNLIVVLNQSSNSLLFFDKEKANLRLMERDQQLGPIAEVSLNFIVSEKAALSLEVTEEKRSVLIHNDETVYEVSF